MLLAKGRALTAPRNRDEARRMLEEALRLFQEPGARFQEAQALEDLGHRRIGGSGGHGAAARGPAALRGDPHHLGRGARAEDAGAGG
ncbi:hypothetical protein [Nocardiopsis gilva]|uniref:hypothetical protein n=1 Tax=Nocardiopsis gilva TaxID=280236 RepID=UPI0003450879|nr:hypothetical protein [Nocardiopsis gilva]